MDNAAIKKIPVLLLMMVMSIVILGASFALYRHNQGHLDEIVQARLNELNQLIQSSIERDAELMNALIDFLEQDPCIHAAWRQRDRDALLGCTESRYRKIRQRYRITHFYFHQPDRVNFLRVHNPKRHGDVIKRFTMAAAVRNGEPVHGMELGPYGTFTLRVVRPWRIDGELVGYIELGEEVQHFMSKARKQLKGELFLLVNKDLLQRELWEKGLVMLGKRGDWDHFSRFAMADGTLATLPPSLHQQLEQFRPNQPAARFDVSFGGRAYRGGYLPMLDYTGRPVGVTAVLADVTRESSAAATNMSLFLALALLFGGLLAAIVWSFLGRLEKRFVQTQERLQGEIERHQATELRLKQHEKSLQREARARRLDAVEEEVLGDLMRLVIRDDPMEEFLYTTLTTLLDSVPWLELLPKGAVFLTVEEGRGQELEMSAAVGMDAEIKTRCHKVPFGKCLCGRAALNRDIEFTDCVDERHEISFPGMAPHGHFSVPILAKEQVLGVLVLYIPAGHVSDEGETEFLCRVADILSVGIARRYAQLALIKARDEAEAASRAKSDFLAALSHEIRTPMNGVLGMTELLRDTRLDVQQREFIDTIHRSGRSLIAVINDILDYSKMEAGHLELSPIPFDLERAVHDVVMLMMPKAEEKALELVFNYDACPRRVVGDAGRIRQILMNLLGNAIKYTHKGRVVLSVNCKTVSPDEVTLSVEVSDTGIGISEEDQTQIFRSFPQLSGTTARKYSAGGLGLAFSRQLVILMGGEMGVKSRLGEGSSFWFHLRLPVGEVPEPLPHAQLNDIHVLVVDDNRVNLLVLEEQLRAHGMRVTALDRMDQVLPRLEQWLQSDPVQLALLDYVMPGLDGEQVVRQIKSDDRFADLPLILLTSAGKKGDAQRFKEAGFSAYLSKPVLSVVLLQTLSSVLGMSKQRIDKPELITRHTVEEAVRQPPEQAGQPSVRILLAEDVPTNQKVTESMLRRMGVMVDTATTGTEAVEYWSRSQYDLIFMDIQMPEMDGVEAARVIREREADGGRHTPIIALTANVMEADRKLCLDAGMDGFIAKPFSRDDLVIELTRWLPADLLDGLGITPVSPPRETPQVGRRREDAVDVAKLEAVRETLGEDFDGLVATYLSTADEMLQAIPEAWNASDQQEVERLFHSLKSSSASIGAMLISEMARRMEEEVRAGSLRDVVAAVNEMRWELDRVRHCLQAQE